MFDNSALVFVLLPTLEILITSRPVPGVDMFWFTRFSSAKRITERLPTARIEINRMTIFIYSELPFRISNVIAKVIVFVNTNVRVFGALDFDFEISIKFIGGAKRIILILKSPC